MAVTSQPENNKLLLVPVDGTRGWSTGLCECCNNCSSCMGTIFCTHCRACSIASRMHECALLPLCTLYSAIIPMRTKVRTMGGIQGSICGDWCIAGCCTPCVIYQISRELDNMGL